MTPALLHELAADILDSLETLGPVSTIVLVEDTGRNAREVAAALAELRADLLVQTDEPRGHVPRHRLTWAGVVELERARRAGRV